MGDDANHHGLFPRHVFLCGSIDYVYVMVEAQICLRGQPWDK